MQVKEEWQLPPSYPVEAVSGELIPWGAGRKIPWKIVSASE
jgi:hypothetical protein